jgi:ligand-binding SRPBCC domain-containing protein
MTRIILHTLINASQERCFDLSRDADVHLLSTKQTKERVVSGRSTGLFELYDEVTWEAVHLGVKQKLSSVITGFDRPVFFEDTMKKGAFKTMRHEHHFKKEEDATLMTDIFEYEVPFGLPGKIFDLIYLRKYMINLLNRRNACIKELAEKNVTER